MMANFTEVSLREAKILVSKGGKYGVFYWAVCELAVPVPVRYGGSIKYRIGIKNWRNARPVYLMDYPELHDNKHSASVALDELLTKIDEGKL